MALIGILSNNPKTEGAREKAEDAQWLSEHGRDPKALDEKYSARAQSACSVGANDFLRSIAAHDFKWDDDATGFLGTKFDKFSTQSAGTGLLTLISARAKLANGFGAFEHIDVYCLYNVGSGNVVRYSQGDPAFDVMEAPRRAPSHPTVVYAPPSEEPQLPAVENQADAHLDY